jgi:hypothetical protein
MFSGKLLSNFIKIRKNTLFDDLDYLQVKLAGGLIHISLPDWVLLL